MKALAKSWKDRLFGRSERPLREPDPAFGKPRPMTGLKLSAEQRAKLASYTGSINHGDAELKKPQA